MKKITTSFFVLLIIAITSPARSQTCTCADNYTWLKETFEKNDAGFQYVVDQKGEADYKKHCELYAEKVKSITGKEPCAEALSEWLHYFRKGHLWLQMIRKDQAPKQETVDKDKIRQQFSSWETYPYNEKEFKAYLTTLKEPGLEGIWTSPPYTIGVKKERDHYLGFVIEGDGVYWSKGQVKFRIRDSSGLRSATYYMRDHTASEIKEVKLPGNNYLIMDFVQLKRVSPSFPPDQSLDRHFRLQSTQLPLFEKLSDKTVLLRIPSFGDDSKEAIDKLIATHMKTITSTENLIIDLRNNGGGSDGSYDKLVPLIYTNPISVVGVELLSTPLNNKRMEGYASDPDLPADEKKWAEEALEKLNKNIGKFVNLDSGIVSIETQDTVYACPKKVGILVNGGCGSTTEQFLLAAKQSKKVKLFGTSTFGSLDISNMYSVTSPCKDLELGYCLSKSYRIPDFTIDGKGIQPDFFLDRSVAPYEWIDYAEKILVAP